MKAEKWPNEISPRTTCTQTTLKLTVDTDGLIFIHSFIHLLNKTIVKSAVKWTIEQDSKDKAVTAAQKLKLHKNYICSIFPRVTKDIYAVSGGCGFQGSS